MSCALCKITITYMLSSLKITHNATFPEMKMNNVIIVLNLATKVIDTIYFPVREPSTGKQDLVNEFP